MAKVSWSVNVRLKSVVTENTGSVNEKMAGNEMVTRGLNADVADASNMLQLGFGGGNDDERDVEKVTETMRNMNRNCPNYD